MATRCIIKIKGSSIVLYKHWDGHPKSTLPWLKAFLNDFTTKRGIDTEYLAAQLVRSSALDAAKYGLDDSRHTGWGLLVAAKQEHIEIGQEYEYELQPEKNTVKVTSLYPKKSYIEHCTVKSIKEE